MTAAEASSSAPVPEAPYPGLRPFHAHESEIFFGRDEHVADMLTVLEDHRFLAVVGPSGGGKSSLVLAGLIPALRQGLLLTAQSADWRMVVLRPGDAPFANLAAAMQAGLFPQADSAGRRDFHDGDRAFTEIVLRSNPFGFLQSLRDADLPARTNVLLVVDQFEELFRFRNLDVGESLHKSKSASAAAERRNDAAAFVQLLLETVRQSSRPVYVLLTMRSDFLGECDVFEGLPQAINASQFLTPRLNLAQLEQAIARPVALPRFHGRVAPELVQRILNELGQDRDQLPIVQHAMFRTWQHALARRKTQGGEGAAEVVLTLADYDAVGGVAEALSNHADEAAGDLERRGLSRVVERVFRALCSLGPTGQRVRRPVRVRQLAAESGASEADVMAVVDAFRRPDRCLLMPPSTMALTAESVVDISHESLLRQWRRMQDPGQPGGGWLDKEEEAARRWQRLAESARIDHDRTRITDSGADGAKLRDPELQRVLNWWAEDQPTPAWSERYETLPFAQIEAFVRSSEHERGKERERDARRRREREEAKLREQELEHTKELAEVERRRARLMHRMFAVVSVVAVVALVMFGLALKARNTAQTARGAAEISEKKAKAASTEAEKSAEAARLAAENEGQARQLAEHKSALAEAERLAVLASNSDADDRRVVLAVEAVRLAEKSPNARQALLDAVPPRSLMERDSSFISLLAFSDGEQFIIANQEGTHRVKADRQGWTQSEIATGIGPPMAWNLDRSRYFLNQDDVSLHVVGVSTGNSLDISLPNETPTRAISRMTRLAAGRGRAVAGFSDGRMVLADVPTQSGHDLGRFDVDVTAVAVSRDDRFVAGGTRDGTLTLWSADADPERIWRRPKNGSAVVGLDFTADSQTLVVALADGTINFLNFKQLNPQDDLTPLFPGDSAATALGVSPGGQWLVAGFDSGRLVIWKVAEPLLEPTSPQAVKLAHRGSVLCLVFSEDGNQLASVGEDGLVQVRQLNDGAPFPALTLRDSQQSISVFDFAGPRVVTGSNRLLLWDLNTQHLLDAAPRVAKRNLSHTEWNQFFPQVDYRQTFPGLPTPEEIVNKSDHSIRYFVEQLPQVPNVEASDILKRASEAWQSVANVTIRPVPIVEDANVVIRTVPTAEYVNFGDATIGPPQDLQLEMRFDANAEWDAAALEIHACHSFGHILGLEHSASSMSIMSQFRDPSITSPQPTDIAEVQKIWGTNIAEVEQAQQGLEAFARALVAHWETESPDAWTPQAAPVVEVQQALQMLVSSGYLRAAAVDEFNAKSAAETMHAVRSFQNLAGIKADGFLSQLTLKHLLTQYSVCTSTIASSKSTALAADADALLMNETLPRPVVFYYGNWPQNVLDQSEAQKLIWEAVLEWQRNRDIRFLRTNNSEDANLIFTMDSFADQPNSAGSADLGGPDRLRRSVLTIKLNTRDADQPAVLRHALLHHLGHVLGLEHSQEPVSIMNPLLDRFEPVSELSRDDINRIEQLWGRLDGTSKN